MEYKDRHKCTSRGVHDTLILLIFNGVMWNLALNICVFLSI